jgi:arylsulfatase A-like enzyme
VLLAALGGCAEAEDPRSNVLLLLADDIGVDRIGTYAHDMSAPRTPVIDALARTGVRFETVWATPMCSSTRAALLTGRLPLRNGIGGALSAGPELPGLDLETGSPPLARLLATAGYHTFLIGKWHLAGGDRPNLGHIERAGFAQYAGWPHNLPGLAGWSLWPRFAGGEVSETTRYPTTVEVDDALAAIAAAPEPWFGWVGFHDAHGPPHEPPADLHSYQLGTATRQYGPDHFRAAVEALDREIGRLLAGIPPRVRARTTVIFVSDNGTPRFALEGPSSARRGKHSLFEGGVHVPLIVSSPRVPVARRGETSRALVHVTDLYATIAELAGVEASAEDSLSLVPYLADPSRSSVRGVLYTERFRSVDGVRDDASWARAARGPRFKLLQEASGRQRIYDLIADPRELRDLLQGSPVPALVEEARARLAAVIETGDMAVRARP